jgi:hypothetical protein
MGPNAAKLKRVKTIEERIYNRLKKQQSYYTIQQKLQVSPKRIARVAACLRNGLPPPLPLLLGCPIKIIASVYQ